MVRLGRRCFVERLVVGDPQGDRNRNQCGRSTDRTLGNGDVRRIKGDRSHRVLLRQGDDLPQVKAKFRPCPTMQKLHQ